MSKLEEESSLFYLDCAEILDAVSLDIIRVYTLMSYG